MCNSCWCEIYGRQDVQLCTALWIAINRQIPTELQTFEYSESILCEIFGTTAAKIDRECLYSSSKNSLCVRWYSSTSTLYIGCVYLFLSDWKKLCKSHNSGLNFQIAAINGTYSVIRALCHCTGWHVLGIGWIWYENFNCALLYIVGKLAYYINSVYAKRRNFKFVHLFQLIKPTK